MNWLILNLWPIKTYWNYDCIFYLKVYRRSRYCLIGLNIFILIDWEGIVKQNGTIFMIY